MVHVIEVVVRAEAVLRRHGYVGEGGRRHRRDVCGAEAEAREIVALADLVSGVRETIEAVPDGEAGLLAEPGDLEGLAGAITRTLRDPGGARQRAAAARRRAEKLFDIRRNAVQLSDVFRNAVLGKQEARVRR